MLIPTPNGRVLDVKTKYVEGTPLQSVNATLFQLARLTDKVKGFDGKTYVKVPAFVIPLITAWLEEAKSQLEDPDYVMPRMR